METLKELRSDMSTIIAALEGMLHKLTQSDGKVTHSSYKAFRVGIECMLLLAECVHEKMEKHLKEEE